MPRRWRSASSGASPRPRPWCIARSRRGDLPRGRRRRLDRRHRRHVARARVVGGGPRVLVARADRDGDDQDRARTHADPRAGGHRAAARCPDLFAERHGRARHADRRGHPRGGRGGIRRDPAHADRAVGYGAGTRPGLPQRAPRRGRRGGPRPPPATRSGDRGRARDQRRRPQPGAPGLRDRAAARGGRSGRVAHPDRDEEGTTRGDDLRAVLSVASERSARCCSGRPARSACARPSSTSGRSSANRSRSLPGTGRSA